MCTIRRDDDNGSDDYDDGKGAWEERVRRAERTGGARLADGNFRVL